VQIARLVGAAPIIALDPLPAARDVHLRSAPIMPSTQPPTTYRHDSRLTGG